MKNLIFIPFDVLNNKHLIELAIEWQSNLEFTPKDYKIPDIITYCKNDREEKVARELWKWNPDIYYAFSEEDIEDEAVLYVMCHGTRSALIASSDQQSAELIDMTDLSARLKRAGFIPELLNKINTLKLYCCEIYNGTAEELAIQLAKALGKDYKKLNITYYMALVTIYYHTESDGPSKMAHMRLKNGKKIYLGNASQFTGMVNVGEVIDGKAESFRSSTGEMQKLLGNVVYVRSNESIHQFSECKEIEAKVISTQITNKDEKKEEPWFVEPEKEVETIEQVRKKQRNSSSPCFRTITRSAM